MRYMGGKYRLRKQITGVLFGLMQRLHCEHFVDLFCGACNVVGNMPAQGRRIANDRHPDLVALWQAVQSGYSPPPSVSAGLHKRLMASRGQAPSPLRAFVGFGCSYRGIYFGGYDSRGAAISKASIERKRPCLTGVEFHCGDYRDVVIPPRSLIYCDIPYQGTQQYGQRFDHTAFWDWAEQTSRHTPVVVSEYERNVTGRNVIVTYQSNCWLSVIPTVEALVLLEPL